MNAPRCSGTPGCAAVRTCACFIQGAAAGPHMLLVQVDQQHRGVVIKQVLYSSGRAAVG